MASRLMDVYCYQDGDSWIVRGGSHREQHSSRTKAFAAARDLLRANSPGRLLRQDPGNTEPPESPPEPPPPDARSDRPGDRPDHPDSPSSDSSGAPAEATANRRRSTTRPGRVSARPAGTTQDWARLQGPAVLGRSVAVDPGAEPPEPWAACARIAIPAAGAPTELLERVRSHFLDRVPTVFELVPADRATAAGDVPKDVWRTPVDFELVDEAIRYLALANTVDARAGAASPWPLADRAVELGASFPSGDEPRGDVVLADGQPAYCDGGPFWLWRHDEVAAGTAVLTRLSIDAGRLQPIPDGEPAAALAPDQLEAVADPRGRARIIAPAGSGKTRVLTERARFLLATKKVPEPTMTLVAFNKRAQEEMRDRTRDLPGLQVQTLNAMALAILNGTSGFRKRSTRVDTIDERGVRDLLHRMIKFPRRTNTDPAAAWMDALSSVRLGLRAPRLVEDDFGGDVEGLAAFFPKYRAELHKRGVVDFDEQIYAAIEVLLHEPETRQHAQQRCRLLLVDEFQDLTPAHLVLLRLLAGPELNVFGVGDDDQTIYGYSGASPDWLIDFDGSFPGSGHHALTVNYRCPVPVVEAATNLLSHNARRIDKTIHAGPDSVADMSALEVIDDDEPALRTISLVADLVEGGVAPHDIAVLARVNTLLAPLQVGLNMRGIATSNLDGSAFVERTGVAAALSWLRLAVTTGRLGSADIQRAARRPGRSLSPKVIEWMAEQDDVEGLERLAGRLSNDRDAEKVHGFATDVARIRQLGPSASADTILEFVNSELGLERSLAALDQARRGRNTAANSDDLRALIALGQLHPDAKTFAKWLHDALANRSTTGGVSLSTVHRVKGLEWPHVIVHDATDSIFPHRLAEDDEEERRVFHVAITRGQQSVTVVAERGAPSGFLAELFTRADPAALAQARNADLGRRRREQKESKRDARSSKREVPAPADVDPELFDALKTWRKARASAEGMAAFIIASDKTLQALAAACPRNEAELLQVSGIGPTKAERYGDEILAVVDRVRPPGD